MFTFYAHKKLYICGTIKLQFIKGGKIIKNRIYDLVKNDLSLISKYLISSGIVVQGTAKDLKEIKENPMIKHAILGNILDKL